MGGPAAATSTQDRQTGFLQQMALHPEVEVTSSHADAYSFEAGRNEMLRLVAETPAEAYFCGDDVLSIGAMSAIKSAGLSVPKDIGLLGLNDMEIAGWENVNLTTIHNPVESIIAASIELVDTMF